MAFSLSQNVILINGEYNLMPLLFFNLNLSQLLKGQTLPMLLREGHYRDEIQCTRLLKFNTYL